MSEIPEHLLKRSRSAKAGKTGGDAGSESAPAAASPSAPAPAGGSAPAAAASVPANLPNLDPEPVPAKPEPHYVVAAKARRRVPVWALPIVAALPVWAIAYPGTMQEPPREDPLITESTLLYTGGAGCAGCHGAGGGGGLGYAFTGGALLETFPNPIDQMVHVARGSAAIEGKEYGAVRKDGARHVAGAKGSGQMPAQEKQLTQIELEMVVFHERELAGEDQTSPEYIEWMDSMRERYEAGNADPIDLEFLLQCADPEFTPEATGEGSSDETKPCPGPPPAEESA